jgi:hypothetical protein
LKELSDTSRVISLTRLTPRIEQYLDDIESASAKGFDTIFDEFSHATNTYKAAKQNEVSLHTFQLYLSLLMYVLVKN